MPNEVIAQVHRWADTAEKYDGIVFTDMNGNVLSEQYTEKETHVDTESETSEEQQPMGVGGGLANDEESENTFDNNQMMELDNSDIQCNTEYNDDNIIKDSTRHNAEDEYNDAHAEQKATIEEAPIKNED